MASVPLLAVLLAASAGAPIKLASPGLRGVNVKADLQTFVTDHLNQQLVMAGVQVISASEVSAVLGLERQKQLLGCSETASSCVAELASALGVDGILLGNLGQFGDTLQLDVRVASSTDARPMAVFSKRVANQNLLLDALAEAAGSIAQQLTHKTDRPLVPVTQAAPSSTPQRVEMRNTPVKEAGKWTFLASSAVLVAGVFVAGLASTNDTTAIDTGGALAIVGFGGMLVGGGMYLFGGTEPVQVNASLIPRRTGLSFGLNARW